MQSSPGAQRQVQQPDHPGAALDQGPDHRGVVAADDEISFPVPGLGSVGRLERALMDAVP